MPANLLLITGPPASGKSRLARLLAERFHASCCSKDEIKDTLFEVLGTGDAAWSRRLSDASFALLFQWGARLLSAQPLLLMDGNFRPGEHEPAVRTLLSAAAARSAQVLCVAGPDIRAARLAARAAEPDRHPGHRDQQLSLGPLAPTGFLDLPGPRLRFGTDRDEPQELARLCDQLDRWLAAA
ncbi:MAG: AAA family ATPase [Steroidobacteraceae bacterium]